MFTAQNITHAFVYRAPPVSPAGWGGEWEGRKGERKRTGGKGIGPSIPHTDSLASWGRR